MYFESFAVVQLGYRTEIKIGTHLTLNNSRKCPFGDQPVEDYLLNYLLHNHTWSPLSVYDFPPQILKLDL